MAARKLRVQHQDEIRAKIQSTQLVNALQNHVTEGNLSQSQVTAALGLLKKTISDAPTDVNLSGSVVVEFGLGRSSREA